jgi:hypothetical protein
MPYVADRAIPADENLYNRIIEKVKARVDRWPSAYASGQVVQEYKAAMEKKGLRPYLDPKPASNVGLARWYRENWVDIKTGKPCGSVKSADYYPTCRPAKRITQKSPVTTNELNANQKKAMIEKKQEAKKVRVAYTETKAVRERKLKHAK